MIKFPSEVIINGIPVIFPEEVIEKILEAINENSKGIVITDVRIEENVLNEDKSFITCAACGKVIRGNPWRNLFHEDFCKECFCSDEVNVNHHKPRMLIGD